MFSKCNLDMSKMAWHLMSKGGRIWGIFWSERKKERTKLFFSSWLTAGLANVWFFLNCFWEKCITKDENRFNWFIFSNHGLVRLKISSELVIRGRFWGIFLTGEENKMKEKKFWNSKFKISVWFEVLLYENVKLKVEAFFKLVRIIRRVEMMTREKTYSNSELHYYNYRLWDETSMKVNKFIVDINLRWNNIFISNLSKKNCHVKNYFYFWKFETDILN